VISVTPRPRFTPGERTPDTHWTGGWVGPRAGLNTEVRGKILLPLPGIEPRSPGRPARSQTLYCLSYAADRNKKDLIYPGRVSNRVLYMYVVLSVSVFSGYSWTAEICSAQKVPLLLLLPQMTAGPYAEHWNWNGIIGSSSYVSVSIIFPFWSNVFLCISNESACILRFPVCIKCPVCFILYSLTLTIIIVVIKCDWDANYDSIFLSLCF
jgi:hypothetical protein